MIRWKKQVVLGLLIGIGVAVALISRWQPTMTISVDSSLSVAPNESIEPVPFSITGRFEHSKESGHADSPLGVWGQDRCSLSGILRCGASDALLRIDLDGWVPLAMVVYQRRLYLVCRHCHQEGMFRLLCVDGNTVGVCVDDKHILSVAAAVRFRDRDTEYYFAASAIRRFVDNHAYEHAATIFAQKAEGDPRFIYRPNWRVVRETDMVDAIDAFMDGERLVDIYESWRRMLIHSESSDDPQVIRAIARSMLRTDLIRGQRDVVAWMAEWDGRDGNDMRRLAIEGLLESR